MYQRTDISYLYDGTWEGLLSCVFESFRRKELPGAVLPWDMPQGLLPARAVETEADRARRVEGWMRAKISLDFWEFCQRAYLTCLPGKEAELVRLAHLAHEYGPGILDHLTEPTVHRLTQAVRHLEQESHLLCGFVRFSLVGNILVSQIGPKNRVLPLLAPHFAQRYPREAFLIHDKTHGMALVYRPYEWAIIPMDAFEMAPPDSEEARCRALWRQFYDAIAIPGRENPRCRMTHMPKRYWEFMTEIKDE